MTRAAAATRSIAGILERRLNLDDSQTPAFRAPAMASRGSGWRRSIGKPGALELLDERRGRDDRVVFERERRGGDASARQARSGRESGRAAAAERDASAGQPSCASIDQRIEDPALARAPASRPRPGRRCATRRRRVRGGWRRSSVERLRPASLAANVSASIHLRTLAASSSSGSGSSSCRACASRSDSIAADDRRARAAACRSCQGASSGGHAFEFAE